PGQQMSLHAGDRELSRKPEEPQIEHRGAAHEHDEAENMQDLDDRIEPERLAHRRRGTSRLEPGEPAGMAGLCQRSCTVAPSIVMRSARISSSLVRCG